jgi:exodeoxyribonuclease VII small subunit
MSKFTKNQRKVFPKELNRRIELKPNLTKSNITSKTDTSDTSAILDNQERSFENQLNQLETIVKNMSNNQLDLDEALNMFEQGTRLSQNCQDLLNNAEQKVSLIREK